MSAPEPPPEQFLEHVLRRGRVLRRRRRIGRAALAGAPVVLLALVVAGLAVAEPTGRKRQAVTAGPGDTTTTTTTTVKEETTTTTTTTTAGPTTTTTTTAKPAPTTMPPPCTDADYEVSVSTDKPSYARGETVSMTTVIRNVSSKPCTAPEQNEWCTTDEQGKGTCVHQIQEYASPDDLPPPLAPGADRRQTREWNQRHCTGDTPDTCGQAIPGRYRITMKWSKGPSAETWVTIEAA